MESPYYSDTWKRLLYTKISFPYEIDEAARVVQGGLGRAHTWQEILRPFL